jgi:hypothetical protein
VGQTNYLTNIPLEISFNGTAVSGSINFVSRHERRVAGRRRQGVRHQAADRQRHHQGPHIEPSACAARKLDQYAARKAGHCACPYSTAARRAHAFPVYLTDDGTVSVIAVGRDATPYVGAPTSLFQVPGALPDWGVSPDGNRFLLAVPVRSASPFDVLLHWDVGLQR